MVIVLSSVSALTGAWRRSSTGSSEINTWPMGWDVPQMSFVGGLELPLSICHERLRMVPTETIERVAHTDAARRQEQSSMRWRVMGLAVLVITVIGLTLSWMSAVRTVHPIYATQTNRVSLTANEYLIYQDPGGAYFATASDAPGAFDVVGPGGKRISVTAVPTTVHVSEVGGVFLGTGLFAPVASFTAPDDGSYTISLLKPDGQEKMFVGRTGTFALVRVGPWLLGLFAGLAITVWSEVVILTARRRRRRAGVG
jgi:hypothetical protein